MTDQKITIIFVLFACLLASSFYRHFDTLRAKTLGAAGAADCNALVVDEQKRLVMASCDKLSINIAEEIPAAYTPFLFKNVPVNFASMALLTTVKGIGPKLAGRIVDYRENKGPLRDKNTLEEIQGVGPVKAASLAAQLSFTIATTDHRE